MGSWKEIRVPDYVWFGVGAFAVGALLFWAGHFYFYVVLSADATGAERWGVRGDAMGPFAALFNAGALVAALSAIYMQRRESHESGEATRKQIEKMSEQVAQFARAADAQQALADSQARLAEAQERANALSVRALSSQHAQNIVSVAVANAHIECAIEDLRSRSPNMGEAFERGIKSTRDGLETIAKTESEEMKTLRVVFDDAVTRIGGKNVG